MISKENWTLFSYGELWVEMHIVYEVIYIEYMGVANWKMNEIILEFLIFEFMESNNIGVWSCIVDLNCYILNSWSMKFVDQRMKN